MPRYLNIRHTYIVYSIISRWIKHGINSWLSGSAGLAHSDRFNLYIFLLQSQAFLLRNGRHSVVKEQGRTAFSFPIGRNWPIDHCVVSGQVALFTKPHHLDSLVTATMTRDSDPRGNDKTLIAATGVLRNRYMVTSKLQKYHRLSQEPLE